MQSLQALSRHAQRTLLSADEVAARLGIDVSTVYRMAADGRLVARKIGRQWRFPPEVLGLDAQEPAAVGALDPAAARAAMNVAAELLGVMMVVTDLTGRPVTDVVNPCPRYLSADDNERLECLDHWAALADTADLGSRFVTGPMGFQCAVAFIRSGDRLVGMVLAGGIADPAADDTDGLHPLDPAQRSEVIASLPRIAAALGASGALHDH